MLTLVAAANPPAQLSPGSDVFKRVKERIGRLEREIGEWEERTCLTMADWKRQRRAGNLHGCDEASSGYSMLIFAIFLSFLHGAAARWGKVTDEPITSKG